MIDLSKALVLLMSKYYSITRIAKAGNEIGSHRDKTSAKKTIYIKKWTDWQQELMTIPISLIKTVSSD